MKVIAYLRVSTDEQSLGIEAQRAACEAYCQKQKLSIALEIIEEDISGGADLKDRIGLMQALNQLSKGDILLCAKRDRLARDKYVIAFIEKEIEKKKSRVISCAGEGTEQNDPASKMLSGIIDVFAVYERDLIRARTKAALQTKKAKGQRVGHIPFGQQLAADGIHLEACAIEQDILQQISDLKSRGLSVRAVAAAMNGRKAFNRGAEWNASSIHRILQKAA